KGRKRKRSDTTDVASAEGRTSIVPFEYGPILVREEFSNEISAMVLEHLNYAASVFEDIRGDLEEGDAYTIDDMRIQSREAGNNILSEFMARVRDVVGNTSVYDGDMQERGIDEDEASSVVANMHRVITIRHAEILDKMLLAKRAI
uniref:hypothetical protein n=1 Tax=Candidatus Ichthyocystis hellenicum TaxID=1561003 RepID=UPI00158466F6